MFPRNSLLLHHWQAKLGSLALATVLWLVIRHSVKESTGPATPPPAAAEAVPRE